MNFKKLKEKLLGKRTITEGTGYVRLKNRLDEAEFDWSKFPEKEKDPGPMTSTDFDDPKKIGRTSSHKQAQARGNKSNTPSTPPGGITMTATEFKNKEPVLYNDLEIDIEEYGKDTGIALDLNTMDIDIIDYGGGKWIAEFPMGNVYDRFYVHPKSSNENTWVPEEYMDDNLFNDYK